jgi:mutual gliding-motility protein MglA
MSIINYASREIQFKIVYYGPALCGKTTNLAYVHQRISPKHRGELVSLATASDRTLFFDFLPLNAVVI